MKKTAEILCVIVLLLLVHSCKKENKPPTINSIQFNPTEIITNSVVTLTATATDPEGDNLSYTWNCPKGTFTNTTGQSVNWTAPTDAGTYQITVTVNDGKNTVSQTSNVVVLPAIGSLSVNSTPSGANIFIDGVDTKKITPSNFNDMPLGIKIISVTKTGYLSNKDTIAVSIKYKKTSTISFTLVAKANISGNVYYAGTKIPVSGVTITISNKTFTTSTTGSYGISEIASGNEVITASKPDYDPFSKSLVLSSGDNTLNIEMTSGIYTNTITGTVKTSIGTIISGVIVYLLNEDGSSTNIHDQTDASGKYQLPAVPQGQRQIKFSKQRFVDDQKIVFVSNASRTFDEVLNANLITPFDPVLSLSQNGDNQIKWSSSFGPELMGFNLYRSSTLNGNYIKINSSLITTITNPSINGYIYYDDRNYDIYSENYYKISAVNTNSYEGPFSNNVLFPFVSFKVQDIDLNNYNVIKIGNQLWMASNLQTTKFNDGLSIQYLSSDTISSYYWYNNDINYKNTYGAHYNWYAVNTGKLCPTDWHVPSDAEWDILITYLAGNAGGKLKESGTAHWITTNTNASNSTGFTALPGGSSAHYAGTHFYHEIGEWGNWWSSSWSFYWSGTYGRLKFGIYYYIRNDWDVVIKDNDDKPMGMSVRCMKDI
jgi:uncharacterized protein (TIGR02145 family)